MSDISSFLQSISDSGILSAVEVDALRDNLIENSTDVAVAAKELVRRRKLTLYQAGVLCEEQDGPLSIGEYIVLNRIGEGGQGVVFRVRRRNQKDTYALKVLPDRLSGDSTAVRRFQREIETAVRLSHPNIVATVDGGKIEGTHYLTMEYVNGLDLSKFVAKHGALPVWTVMDCVLPTSRALTYAHEENVIHRDIKPSNILIDNDGTIRVLDMGLARVVTPVSQGNVNTVTDLTASGAVLGTADYMAPEQALNAKNSDARTDIYSLGCTTFFLLAGRPIYDGETVMEKIIAHREEPIPSVLALDKENIPPEFDRLFQRMVAKKPEDRPQKMSEVCEVLESIRTKHQYSWMMRSIVARRRERWPRSDI